MAIILLLGFFIFSLPSVWAVPPENTVARIMAEPIAVSVLPLRLSPQPLPRPQAPAAPSESARKESDIRLSHLPGYQHAAFFESAEDIHRAQAAVREVERIGEDLRDSLASPRPTLEQFLISVRQPDSKQRAAAVAAFSTPGNFAAIPYVSAILLRIDEDAAVRMAAAEGLGRIGDSRAQRFLSAALLDSHDGVRFAAVMALGQIGGQGGAGLERLLRSDPSWWVRYAAAATLGRSRKPRAAGWLRRAARADSAWQVRFQAVLALGELGTDAAIKALSNPLRDPEPMVRAGAALALARIGGSGSAELLARSLERENERGVRSVLSWALARTRGD
ncbi:MAG TPA: hypothetical protein DEB40_07340 [Elusimicrobia bacterium]|nr:hypothetical protein [Elusimicrobiota bacterium]HBT61541.1 hypothetical protein [Elusimicrobiota bacterium]